MYFPHQHTKPYTTAAHNISTNIKQRYDHTCKSQFPQTACSNQTLPREKSVPTLKAALEWTSNDYQVFINTYTGGTTEWEPKHRLQYNISPKSTTFSNAPSLRLEVGTEPALRYLANTYHVIAETKKRCSENQLHENCLEVNPDQTTPSPLLKEIGHHDTPSHFHM